MKLKYYVILALAVLAIFIGITRIVKAQSTDPLTTFNIICYEPLRIEGVDKDYIRFKMGYWSTGDEVFETSLITGSSFGYFGQLNNGENEIDFDASFMWNWTTSPGVVNDLIIVVQAEDTWGSALVPVSVIFRSEYSLTQIQLSVSYIQLCEGAVINNSDGLDHSPTLTLTLTPSLSPSPLPTEMPTEVPTEVPVNAVILMESCPLNKICAKDSRTGLYYEHFSRWGVVPLPPPPPPA